MAPRRVKETEKPAKTKKKKKGAYTKDTGEDSGKARKGRRDYTVRGGRGISLAPARQPASQLRSEPALPAGR